MRVLALAAAAFMVSAMPAMASTDAQAGGVTGEMKPGEPMSRTGRSPGPPLDRGPATAEADRAFMSGGMVLEGAPGAPAPPPMAVPESAERSIERMRRGMEPGEAKR
jgi:hypothetical protein